MDQTGKKEMKWKRRGWRTICRKVKLRVGVPRGEKKAILCGR